MNYNIGVEQWFLNKKLIEFRVKKNAEITISNQITKS